MNEVVRELVTKIEPRRTRRATKYKKAIRAFLRELRALRGKRIFAFLVPALPG